MLLHGADNCWYYEFKLDLSNDMKKETNNLPKTMVKTMRMLTNYIPLPRLQHMRDPDGEGLAFIQGEGGASRGPKRDSTNKGEINCWHCSGPHYRNECPKLKLLDAGIQNLNIDNWDKKHSLFLANNGYRLVQKQT